MRRGRAKSVLFAHMAADGTDSEAAEDSKACATKCLISSNCQFQLENYTVLCRWPMTSNGTSARPDTNARKRGNGPVKVRIMSYKSER